MSIIQSNYQHVATLQQYNHRSQWGRDPWIDNLIELNVYFNNMPVIQVLHSFTQTPKAVKSDNFPSGNLKMCSKGLGVCVAQNLPSGLSSHQLHPKPTLVLTTPPSNCNTICCDTEVFAPCLLLRLSLQTIIRRGSPLIWT